MNAKSALTIATILFTSQGYALTALAAQPGAAPSPARAASGSRIALTPVASGKLIALKAAATVEMNTPLTFSFAGSGHCTLNLKSGDGHVSKFEGDLPFTGEYTYSSTQFSSFDAFLDYTASVTPSGNCSISGVGPFTAPVRVVNPHPQSAGTPMTPPQNNTVSLAGNGKLSTPIKPGPIGTSPAVAATITSLTVSGKALTGAPSLAAGSATVLTVNGTGTCKYRLSYVNLDAQGKMIVKQYPMIPKSSSAQSPFPMTLTMLAATPVGVYKWTASGVDGCAGTADATLSVQ